MLWPDLTTPVLCSPGDFSIGFACGDKTVSRSSERSPPTFSPPLALLLSVRPGVYLGAMGKPVPNDSQWLLISTICSALGPLISQRKSNMWRERVTERNTASLTGPLCAKDRHSNTRGPRSHSRSLGRFHTDSVFAAVNYHC